MYIDSILFKERVYQRLVGTYTYQHIREHHCSILNSHSIECIAILFY